MKTVSITSGKGGVGKTNVTANLGLALARRGKRVLLLDADLGLANLDLIFGLRCDYTLFDVVEGRKRVEDVLLEGPEGVRLLPASSGILGLERLSVDQRVHLARQLQPFSESFDVLLIDTGAGLSDNVLFFNDYADGVLLVTAPEPTALTDAYALIKILSNTYRVDTMALVVNQVQSAVQAGEVHETLDGVCRKYLGLRIDNAGYLPADPELPQAVRAGRPALLRTPNGPFSRAIDVLASRFDEVFPREGAARVGFWSAWMGGDDKAGQGGAVNGRH